MFKSIDKTLDLMWGWLISDPNLLNQFSSAYAQNGGYEIHVQSYLRDKICAKQQQKYPLESYAAQYSRFVAQNGGMTFERKMREKRIYQNSSEAVDLYVKKTGTEAVSIELKCQTSATSNWQFATNVDSDVNKLKTNNIRSGAARGSSRRYVVALSFTRPAFGAVSTRVDQQPAGAVTYSSAYDPNINHVSGTNFVGITVIQVHT